MFSGFSFRCLFAVAFLACGAMACGQSPNPSDPSAVLAGENAPPPPPDLGTNSQGGAAVLRPWRAVPNLSVNPMEPSPPSPDADQQGSDSPLKPMTPRDLLLTEDTPSQSNNPVSAIKTNQLVSVEEASNPDDVENVAPPIPGNNLTMAPAMNLPKEVVEVPADAAHPLWRITPRFFMQTLHDDNIYITKSNAVASFLYSLGAGLNYELGDSRGSGSFMKFGYFAVANAYSAASQQNSVNQAGLLAIHYPFTRLVMDFVDSTSYVNGPNRDTGSFVKGLSSVNKLDMSYEYSPRTTLTLGLKQFGNIYPSSDLQNSEFYEIHLNSGYQLTPKINIGPGVVLGLNTVANSPNQRYQQLLGKAIYNVTGKTDLKLDLGYQATEYASGGQGSFGKMIFNLEDVYRPVADVQLGLQAYRRLNNSASLQTQDFMATGFALRGKYDFLTHWSVGLGGGFENDTYQANTAGTASGRVDNFYYYRPSVAYIFLKDTLSLELFYNYRINVSSQEQIYGWQDNQIGLSLSGNF